ncbi:hypothetical protein CBS101457_000175 [Exobasidium rhododendri]|nr:hypothetical protein CBS101457_000175 [Exobasidium rhododendri]
MAPSLDDSASDNRHQHFDSPDHHNQFQYQIDRRYSPHTDQWSDFQQLGLGQTTDDHYGAYQQQQQPHSSHTHQDYVPYSASGGNYSGAGQSSFPGDLDSHTYLDPAMYHHRSSVPFGEPNDVLPLDSQDSLAHRQQILFNLPDYNIDTPRYLLPPRLYQSDSRYNEGNLAAGASSSSHNHMRPTQQEPYSPPDLALRQRWNGIYKRPHHRNFHQAYALRVDPHFTFTSEEEKVYKNLSDRQKLVILELVHRIRPFKAVYLRQKFHSLLTPRLATKLLSGNEEKSNAAIQELFPERRKKKGHETWMSDLPHWERIEVIEKMSEALHNPSDALRDRFLDKHVTPSIAQQILRADMSQCIEIARSNDLELPGQDAKLPWQVGLSNVQKRAVLDRMMAKDVCKATCYDQLSKHSLPPSYGWEMLKASDKKFDKMIDHLRNRANNLPAPLA